ncbi:hypothetical protein [Ktedonobacter sp. SOSP1-52]|uniref:hypothetical protein n=1 Tax=Ktedonobacter sp. SOSP1-52 TaxID=2778366 RepID=UPI001F2083B0|nr:hypothetical protein [Ktedonobacter sp. SOSP1-52]
MLWTPSRVSQRADELVSAYLHLHVQEGHSPWTLSTTRSALRLFFGSPSLASEVALPARHREAIRRSRTSTSHQKRPRHMSAEDWQDLLAFLGATGLRRHEARTLRVGQIERQPDGHVVLAHVHGKGGKIRQVPVLPGQETTILRLVEG